MSLTHIDLFSGIGGFSLAAKWAGFETTVFCEKDPFCQKVLKKHWPDVPIIEDIFEFDGSKHRNATLLTGGVPCQPVSCAGKRRGKEDDRWLWPEALRVIRECKPQWVILENVRGLTSLNGGVEFENLLLELEFENYETRAFLIPACGVDAPHKRERVWIVAHSESKQGWRCFEFRMESDVGTGSEKAIVADTNISRPQGHRELGQCAGELSFRTARPKTGQQYAKWLPEPNVGRLATRIPNRVARLRALGNSIVPQLAFQIISAIGQIETTR